MPGNIQYTQKFGTIRVKANEQKTSYLWYKFLLWALGIGGFSFLAWIWFFGLVAGYRLGMSKTEIPVASTKIEVPGLEKAVTALEAVAEKLASPPPLEEPPAPVQRKPQNFLEWDRQP